MRDRIARRVGRLFLSTALVGAMVAPQAAAWADEPDDANAADAAESDGLGTGSSELSEGNATIIVQLEEQGPFASVLNFITGTDAQDRHARVKGEIRSLAASEASKDVSADDEGSGMSVLSVDQGNAGARAGSASDEGEQSVAPVAGDVEELYDYYHAIDGFAVRAPASLLDEIKAIDGVKNAFIEQTYEVPADQGSDASDGEGAQTAYENASSREAIGVDNVSFTGAGELIAIIDTGLDTDHEAFSGDIADEAVALTEAEAAEVKAGLTSGAQNAAYVSEKIPFAYDYGDGDADVNPGLSGLEHGTHVAGIAAANGGETIRGVAPDAQLAIMKVADDTYGLMYDTAILAAMDDAVAIGVDTVNISLGSDAGFSDAGDPTYSDAVNAMEAAGMKVNVANGNSYTSAQNNQSGENLPYASDPDYGIASTPATMSNALSVASVNSNVSSVVPDAQDGPDGAIVAPDGTQMPYWEALGSDGSERAVSFADVAEGSYELVWGDLGKTSGSPQAGDVDTTTPNSLDGKMVLVYGHGDFYGSVQPYARVAAAMTELGAEAVVFYDPALSESDLAGIMLGGGNDTINGGADYYDPNSCPCIFVTAENGETLKAIAADDRKITVDHSIDPGASSSPDGVIVASDGAQMPYKEVEGPDGLSAPSFADLEAGDYEYVWGGIGRDDDGDDEGSVSSSGIGDENGDVENGEDLTGKIVVVEGRATWIYDIVISLARASNYYYGMGAEAVVFYVPGLDLSNDFVYETDYFSSGVCPGIVVSEEDGMALREAAEKTLTVDHSLSAPEEEGVPVYIVNAFSSWGVTPDLKLKPEIAAPGGNVYSSITNGQYAYMSGTSMASPHVTGMSALIDEYIESRPALAALSDAEKTDLVAQLLMSTATPQRSDDDLDSFVSPRQQGAGLANVAAATSTDVYATVVGSENARPEANLGESSEGSWEFTVLLRNVGETDRAFEPSAAALSDTVKDGLFQLQSKNWTGEGIDVAFSGSSYADGVVTVPAGGSATLTVSISCGDEFKQFASENTPNGTFVDGFAFLTSADGGIDLSVPFMGFYGDWSAASVFDSSAGDGYHTFGTKFIVGDTGYPLGINPFSENRGDEAAIDPDKYVLSNSSMWGAPTSVTSETGMLRNVDKLTYEVVGPDGESEGIVEYDNVKKTYWNSSAAQFVTLSDLSGEPTLDLGSDPEAEEGVYTFKMTAITFGPTPEEQTQSFELFYDTTAPEITDVRYSDNAGDPTLTFTVADNTSLAAVDFILPDTAGLTTSSYFHRTVVSSEPSSVDDEGRNVYEVTVRVADVKAAWSGEGEIPDIVQVVAWDYGMNGSSRTDAVVTPVAAESVAIDAETITAAPGQKVQVTATVLPESSTETDLVWSVGDEGVATVDEGGFLTGVAEGDTTVTVAVDGRPELADTVDVHVADVSAETGIVLSSAREQVLSGESIEVKALLSDDLADAEVEWSIADDVDYDVATIEPSATDPTTATVSADYRVGDATVTAQVTAADGTVKTATMAIEHRTADYADYVIEDIDGVTTLTGYRGASGTVVIPNNVEAIGDRAFEADETVDNIGIPASVTSIGKRAFANIEITDDSSWTRIGKGKNFSFEDTEEHPSTLTTIGKEAFASSGAIGSLVLPGSVTEIGESMCQDCLSLNTVVLPDSVTVIPDNAFNRCMVSDLTISDNVTSIGAGAFNGCLFLDSVKLTDVEEGGRTTGLPSKLERLGNGCFSGTYLADEIVIPGTVKEIEPGVFSSDRFITSITIEEGVESIGNAAFSGTNIQALSLPDSIV